MSSVVTPTKLGDYEIREGEYGPLTAEPRKRSWLDRLLVPSAGEYEIPPEAAPPEVVTTKAPKAAKKRPMRLKTVVVHLKTDQVFKGALLSVDQELMTIKQASLAVSGPSGSISWQPMDGEIVFALENVDFWQSGLDAAILDRTLDIPR